MSDVAFRVCNNNAEAVDVVASYLKEVRVAAGDTPRGNDGFETPWRGRLYCHQTQVSDDGRRML